MKILVIRRDNIGDLVCTTPMISSLREHFPDSNIYALVNDYNMDVVDKHPLLDGVFFYTKLKHRDKGDAVWWVIWRRLRTYFSLRSKKFDYVIVASAGYSKNAVRLAKVAKPKHVISFVRAGVDFDPIIDFPIVSHCEYSARHEVEFMAELLRPLGINAPPGPLVLPKVPLPAVLEKHFQNKIRPVVALHISAREKSRLWPEEYFCQLISILLQRKLDVLVLWAPGSKNDPRHPGDDERMCYVRERFSVMDQLVFYPTNTVKELMGAFACADLVVCSDGGGLHIAAGVGKKVVGLFENLDKKTKHWYPWQVPHRVLTSDSEENWQVDNISVDVVVAAIFDLL